MGDNEQKGLRQWEEEERSYTSSPYSALVVSPNTWLRISNLHGDTFDFQFEKQLV